MFKAVREQSEGSKSDARLTSLPSRMVDIRAGDTVSRSQGIPDVEYGHLYESANAGSDRMDFSVARSIDVIAVVRVYVPFPRGDTDMLIAAGVSASVRAANVNEDIVLARAVPGPSEGCRVAIISHICVVIADTELCSAHTTSASGSTLQMEAILGWDKSHSVVVALFRLA